MGDLAKKTTIKAEALANLIEQFKDQPNLAAFVSAFLNQLQEVEDASFQLITDRTLETSVGVQLDNLGQIIGEERNGLSDDDYRTRLRVQILVNQSSGTVEELLAIIVLLESSVIVIKQTPPAAQTITIIDLDSDPVLLARIIATARQGGVGTILIFTLVPAAQAFTFSQFPGTSETDTSRGFADVALTTGGRFAGALEA